MPWKIVDTSDNQQISDHLHKYKVEGGWLYRSVIFNVENHMMTMCFVPDSNPSNSTPLNKETHESDNQN